MEGLRGENKKGKIENLFLCFFNSFGFFHLLSALCVQRSWHRSPALQERMVLLVVPLLYRPFEPTAISLGFRPRGLRPHTHSVFFFFHPRGFEIVRGPPSLFRLALLAEAQFAFFPNFPRRSEIASRLRSSKNKGKLILFKFVYAIVFCSCEPR